MGHLKGFTAVRVLLVLFTFLVSGCSYIPYLDRFHASAGVQDNTLAIASDYERSRLIALDLVNTLQQIPAVAPKSTRLFADQPINQFGRIFYSEMQDAGYDLRVGQESEDRRLLYRIVLDSARAEPVSMGQGNEAPALYTFYVAAANIKIKRQYRADSQGVWPVSSMYVHGADATQITLIDGLFERSRDTTGVSTGRTTESLSQSASGSAQTISDSPVEAATSQQGIEVASLTSPSDWNEVVTRNRQNVAETRQSNFSDVFSVYKTLREEQLIFPNDSLVMGNSNKRIAREVAANFNPDVDVISVVGCSLGQTNIDDGNARLANGRALRVKEELILAGIAADRVLEEGCWASEQYDQQLPSRGVLLTHKRLNP